MFANLRWRGTSYRTLIMKNILEILFMVVDKTGFDFHSSWSLEKKSPMTRENSSAVQEDYLDFKIGFDLLKNFQQILISKRIWTNQASSFYFRFRFFIVQVPTMLTRSSRFQFSFSHIRCDANAYLSLVRKKSKMTGTRAVNCPSNKIKACVK